MSVIDALDCLAIIPLCNLSKNAKLTFVWLVGRRSIVDESPACGAKGSGFKPLWRQEFINIVCSAHLRKIKLRLGPTLKNYIKKKKLLSSLIVQKKHFLLNQIIA